MEWKGEVRTGDFDESSISVGDSGAFFFEEALGQDDWVGGWAERTVG